MTAQVPIKTNLLNSIKTVIVNGLRNDVDGVFIDPSRGLKEELVQASKSYVNLITTAESSQEVSEERQAEFDLSIHTWVKGDTDDDARERATDLNCKINKILIPVPDSVIAYCKYLKEATSNSFDIMFYSEGLCVAISNYHVKYRHVYGDPYTLNP